MRLLIRIVTAIFAALFVVSLVFSARTTTTLSRAFSTASPESEKRTHHIAVFLPEPSSLFYERVRKGASEAARRHDTALSFHPVGASSPEFTLARYTGIDGAIIHPGLDTKQIRRRLEEFDRAGISIVLIEHGVADNSPWAFVGTNNFDVGRKIGETILSLSSKPSDETERIAIVYSDKSPSMSSEAELIELGLTTVLNGRRPASIARRRTGVNPLDAENLTYQILRNEPELSTLIFTDTNDTLAAIQVIIDLNLVGHLDVIGFGITDAIRDYLDRGVLAATIVVNPELIGAEAVRVMTSLIRDGYSPGYIDTGAEIVRGTR